MLKRRKDMRMVDEALEAVKQQFKLRMERLAERQALFEEVSVGCDPGYCVMYSSPPAETKSAPGHGGEVQAFH